MGGEGRPRTGLAGGCTGRQTARAGQGQTGSEPGMQVKEEREPEEQKKTEVVHGRPTIWHWVNRGRGFYPAAEYQWAGQGLRDYITEGTGGSVDTGAASSTHHRQGVFETAFTANTYGRGMMGIKISNVHVSCFPEPQQEMSCEEVDLQPSLSLTSRSSNKRNH